MLPTMQPLAAVVTGAARGIGAATARLLAERGRPVAIVDLDPAGATVVQAIRDQGGRAVFLPGDVSDESFWAAVPLSVARDLGSVGLFVSNAGIAEVGQITQLGRAAWDHQLAVNLTGAFLGARALLPGLRESRGNIVLVSSVHARVGMPGKPAYAAAKGGLTALTRQLAVDYGPEVRVNCVLPGPILTEAWNDASDADRTVSAAATAAGRLGLPREIASVIAFLASSDASYVTGAEIVVDGGWLVKKDSH